MTMITADAPPARPSRPTTVTVAFWLQLAAALMLFVLVGLTVGYAVYFDHLIDRAVELVPEVDPAEVQSERTGNMVTAAIAGSVFLLGAVAFAATATPLRRGSNAGRIVVFIASGLHFVACLLPCAGGLLVLPFVFAGPDTGYVDPEAVPFEESRFSEILWEQSTSTEDALFAGASLGGLLEVVLVIAIVILIAVPPANRYFVPRGPAPAWPLGAYPAPMPGQPFAAYPTPAPAPGQPIPDYPAPMPGQPFAAYPAPIPGQPYAGYPPPAPYVICPDPSAHVPPPATPAAPEPPPPPGEGKTDA